jgi:hypothetical protein
MVAFYDPDVKSSLPLELPKELVEFIIVKETGWTLEYVRKLSLKDYELYSYMCRTSQQIIANREASKIYILSRKPSL